MSDGKWCDQCNGLAVVTINGRAFCSLHGLNASMADHGKKIMTEEKAISLGYQPPKRNVH